MDVIKCGRCSEEITNKTEVEYSEEYGEFYCNYKCAIDEFFDRARCTPFQFEADEMSKKQVVLKRDKLYHVDDI
ncbi:hypothetical protein G9G63_09265 [Paenibacillus sp. EKM202P]|uniref:hypothetical protein n=1 Tax=unclassified Paenibacillus TaxID=185978 RepID=UPI0013EBCAC0|nr:MULTISPECIES: hypothetical protein [unclassified Paenibacillus]KAF6565338.1 hypothetical protein G9G63_09265 [Paenibacillus sp. EKM202P]KAF6569336.1 hypothetical protein G9G64_12825 [Paenibacillus sp. EKM207P]